MGSVCREEVEMNCARWVWSGAITALLFVLVACSAAPQAPQAIPTDTPAAASPPQSGQGGLAAVTSVDITILESFPVQVHAVVSGSLPDGCVQIDQVQQVREGNSFRVTITTTRVANKACTEAEVPFEQIVPLEVEDLDAGLYIVDVNGVSGSFELQGRNSLSDIPGEGQPGAGGVYVSQVQVEADRGSSAMISIVVQGSLPDACTKIVDASHQIDGQKVLIALQTERPADAICAQMLLPFSQTIQVDAALLPDGTYQVVVNGVPAEAEFQVAKGVLVTGQ
jgi:hypothetical protein